MKYLDVYREILGCKNPDDVFQYIIANLKETIKGWDYFVNWKKVLENYSVVEYELNLLNSLIGKNDIEQEAERLFVKYPEVIKSIPVLLACREAEISLLSDYKNGFEYDHYNFSANMEVEKSVKFLKLSGLLELFADKKIKSIPDYVIGVEAGLDSNGRKNRGGTAMEEIVEYFVGKICNKHGFDYIAQATKKKIFDKWQINITVEKSNREIDFAVLNRDKLFLIETNFYGGVGSKLKSTAGEYKTDFRRWSADGHQFIWITDGNGWKDTHKPLRETFDEIDYILNLDMVENRILEAILKDDSKL